MWIDLATEADRVVVRRVEGCCVSHWGAVLAELIAPLAWAVTQ
jgi:hypothetical protein